MNDFSRILATAGASDRVSGVHSSGLDSVAQGVEMPAYSAIDGSTMTVIRAADPVAVEQAVTAAHAAFFLWRRIPAPRRGELVRQIGQRVRERKSELAAVITAEVGKITAEAEGEIQEWIDICDFATGLSRQLHGLTIVSERPAHRLMEQWHPLGPVGVISAFNFPIAVWAWNAMLALVCGDSVVWKPSEKAGLCALAVHRLCAEVLADFPEAPAGLLNVVSGGRDVGEALANDPRVPLVSATGSVPMGRAVGSRVAARLGRSLLELGGNNAAIITPSADLELALRGVVFGAVGTCGQRCTSLRRLIVHRSRFDEVDARLRAIYARLPIGDPRLAHTLVGPLIDGDAGHAMDAALATAHKQGGDIFGGGLTRDATLPAGGCYVRPALVQIDLTADIVAEETFAPILYLGAYTDFATAVDLQNQVPQGLSSAVFTRDIGEAEQFLSAWGSDCGIANVNLGTSGAEIGGAFGGEKWTGGGRESGSDAWKAYMRRSTNTVNFSSELPLAQGIRFDV